MSAGTLAVTNIEFVEQMFADLDEDAAATVCAFKGDPNEPPQNAWCTREWCHAPTLPSCVRIDANNYVGISSFVSDEHGRHRRRKAQFHQLHAVMVDDVGTKVDADRQVLAPSARIETSPGNCQDYLFIVPSASAYDVNLASRLIEQLVEKALTPSGVDPGMKGVTRLGRLPVGVNGKRANVERLGRPHDCRLLVWEPERRYTIEDIAAAFRLDIALHEPRRAVVGAPTQSTRTQRRSAFDTMLAAISDAGLHIETWKDGSRHAVVCPWFYSHTDRGTTGTVIFEPSAENAYRGGFKCHHGHCEGRSIADVYAFTRLFAAHVVAP